MDVATVAANQNKVKIVNADETGFNSLTSESFLKLMIAQLQNQDPTAPVSNEELLNQISSMRALQSNIELTDTLKSFGLSQSLTAGSSLLGKNVTATIPAKDTNSEDTYVTGVVSKVAVKDNKTYVTVNGNDMPLSQVTQITQ